MAWDQVLGWYITAKYSPPVRRVYCPNCGTPLRETDRGLWCPFGDWHESEAYPPFIPRVPEV